MTALLDCDWLGYTHTYMHEYTHTCTHTCTHTHTHTHTKGSDVCVYVGYTELTCIPDLGLNADIESGPQPKIVSVCEYM